MDKRWQWDARVGNITVLQGTSINTTVGADAWLARRRAKLANY